MLDLIDIAESNSWVLSFDFTGSELEIRIETKSEDYSLVIGNDQKLADILAFMEALEMVEKYQASQGL